MKSIAPRLALLACLGGGIAHADTILGEWSGTGTPIGAGFSQIMDLWINTAVPSGTVFDLTGTADVTCIASPDPLCGTDGVAPVSGTLSGSAVSLGTTANPTALSATFTGASTWSGVVTSLDGGQEAWVFERPATNVPEPATFGLVSLGLLGALRARRNRPGTAVR
jgi:hypothetical protein